jgi:hypothetical protein
MHSTVRRLQCYVYARTAAEDMNRRAQAAERLNNLMCSKQNKIMRNFDLEVNNHDYPDDGSSEESGDERLKLSQNKLRAVSYDTEVSSFYVSPLTSFQKKAFHLDDLLPLSLFPQEPCRSVDSATWLRLASSVALLLL